MESVAALNPAAQATPPASPLAPRWMRWLGLALSALPVLMLLMSATMKLTQNPKMVALWTPKFGYPESLMLPIGLLELTCAIVYLIPQTAVLGAILVTGYLGGAVATHVRVSDAFLIPLSLGVFAWAGLFLRDPRLRALLPLRSADR
jgi:DoxX-like family